MSRPRQVFTYRAGAPTWRSRRQPGSREIHAGLRLTHSPRALTWKGAGLPEPLLGGAGRGLQGPARPRPSALACSLPGLVEPDPRWSRSPEAEAMVSKTHSK